ncbi:hypothetical protein BV898_10095 [Hypsibius exemplaris]|uniref:Uncharacterized protein n=1 Tax=Hypsibius exemplaris TaxID=2072580 RepID=A0A1W0WKM1_HYPEX|nr:hypothetical protein BV898_10095 [Hypsibius exemplaris]
MQIWMRWANLMILLTAITAEQPTYDVEDTPHLACYNVISSDQERPIVTLQCKQEGDIFIIPDNFNITRMSSAIVHLHITNGLLRSDGFTALPAKSTIRSVQLERFNLNSSHPRFPIDQFFAHVKSHLAVINFSNVKLLHLTSKDFEGFVSLENLRLSYVQVDVLAQSVFERLVPDASLSVLSDFEFSGGVMKSFDWSVLQPIARSLKTLKMDQLSLTASIWYSSGPTFQLEQTSTISLQNNSLRQLPQFFLDSLSKDALVSIELHSSQVAFCLNSNKCGCCDLSMLAYWLKDAGLPLAIRSITCGKKRTTFRTFPGTLVYTAICPKPTTTRRTTVRTSQSLPQVTTSADVSVDRTSQSPQEMSSMELPAMTGNTSHPSFVLEQSSTIAGHGDYTTSNDSPQSPTLITTTYFVSTSASPSSANTNDVTAGDGEITTLKMLLLRAIMTTMSHESVSSFVTESILVTNINLLMFAP